MGKIEKAAIIGGGNMGSAIAAGMAGGNIVRAENISVSVRTEASADRLRKRIPGISVFTDNIKACHGADLVILAVKPWQLPDVAAEIRQETSLGGAVIASVVAGTSFRELREMFGCPDGTPFLRIIPNTAISTGKSITFFAKDCVPKDVCDEITAIFRETGEVFMIPEEMMPAGTALASCGIAYALKYLDAAMKGGVEIGFSEEEAEKIVLGTMEGAVSLLKRNGTKPAEEIDKVTTPGGYTFKGLSAMEENGFSRAVSEGLKKSM